MINSQLRLITPIILGENGVLIFFGIDRSGCDVKEIISPPNPITEFYYECTKSFVTERFKNLFNEKPIGHIVFISGEECLIYQYVGIWKKIKSINANLIKRHHMGGQSAVRFSRLAEESRVHYITHVTDWINKLILTKDNNYVFGGRELKEKLLQSSELKIVFHTDDIYHSFNDQTINDDYFTKLVSSQVFKEDKRIGQIVELLEKDCDYLLFSDNEIKTNFDNVEFIVVISSTEKYENKNVIILPYNHHYYSKLKHFQVIGKLYYKVVN
jgi:peptide chain release factor subunit 1